MQWIESRSAREARGEADAEGGTEELLDPGVERAEHAVELVVGDGRVVDLADEEDGVLLADGEGGAVELAVAAEEVLEEGGVVLLRAPASRRSRSGACAAGGGTRSVKVSFCSPRTRTNQRRSPGVSSRSTAATIGFSSSWVASHASMRCLQRVELLGARRGHHGRGAQRQSTRARAVRSP